MAVRPRDLYPAQIVTSDPAYPHGKARNDGVPGDAAGTPLEKAWVNDLWGFLQAILAEAGVTPSGQPDQVGASQYLDALRGILDAGVGARAALSNWDSFNPISGLVAVASNPDGSILVAAGQGVFSSFDGGWTWSQQITPSATVLHTDVIWDGNQFVVVATHTTNGGLSTWTSTDGDLFLTGSGGGGGTGDFAQKIAHDPDSDIYVVGTATGKIFSRETITGPVVTTPLGLTEIMSVERGIFNGAPAFMIGCLSGGNGGVRWARPNALGAWTLIPNTVNDESWASIVYAPKLHRWFVLSRRSYILSMNESGGDQKVHQLPVTTPNWLRAALHLVDDRFLLVVGDRGHVAFGEPDNMRLTRINTTHNFYDVTWNGRYAVGVSLTGGVIRSNQRF